MKIEGINNDKEFEIPVFSSESDVQTTIDLLKLQMKAEKSVAKDLDLDIKEMQKEKLRLKIDKDYVLSEDAKNWNTILSMQLNFDVAFYALHQIDPKITREQVSKLGNTKHAEIVMAMFPPVEKTQDFPKATETVASSP